MSVAAIVGIVEAESVAEATQIVAGARARAAESVAAAESAADARVADACGRASPSYRAEATRRVNAARAQLSERRSIRTADLIDEVIRGAAARLAAIAAEPGNERWTAAIDHLVEETAAAIGPGGVLRVREQDLAAAGPAAERHACRLEALGDEPGARADGPVGGVVGWSADGRFEIDATIRSRLERARGDLAASIVRILGIEA